MPKRRTRLKSFARVRRNLRFTHKPVCEPFLTGRPCHRSEWRLCSVQYYLRNLPTNPLDVIIHAHGQAITTLQPAAFQNLSAIGGFHALPEPVDTDAAAYFRLICALWHAATLSKNNFSEPQLYPIVFNRSNVIVIIVIVMVMIMIRRIRRRQ